MNCYVVTLLHVLCKVREKAGGKKKSVKEQENPGLSFFFFSISRDLGGSHLQVALKMHFLDVLVKMFFPSQNWHPVPFFAQYPHSLNLKVDALFVQKCCK